MNPTTDPILSSALNDYRYALGLVNRAEGRLQDVVEPLAHEMAKNKDIKGLDELLTWIPHNFKSESLIQKLRMDASFGHHT